MNTLALTPTNPAQCRKQQAMATYARTCLLWLDDDPMTRVQLEQERMALRLSRDDARLVEAAVMDWKRYQGAA